MGDRSPTTLVGRHVKIFWPDASRVGGKLEALLFRGRVFHQDREGIWLEGRFFVEKADTLSVRAFPKEKEPDDRAFFVPWSSVGVVELIREGTKEFEIHQLVRARR